MNFNIKDFMTTDFSYWIGLVQSDGGLCRWEKDKKIRYRLDFNNTSLLLAKKFQLGTRYFNANVKIYKFRSKRNQYSCQFVVNSVIDILKTMNIVYKRKDFIPPYWIIENPKFFGSYLAGLIDGDGTVSIKRKKYPQCRIRILSPVRQNKLSNLIGNFMKCSAFVYEHNAGHTTCPCLEFYVTPKNSAFIKTFVLPYLNLNYKKTMIKRYMKTRGL